MKLTNPIRSCPRTACRLSTKQIRLNSRSVAGLSSLTRGPFSQQTLAVARSIQPCTITTFPHINLLLSSCILFRIASVFSHLSLLLPIIVLFYHAPRRSRYTLSLGPWPLHLGRCRTGNVPACSHHSSCATRTIQRFYLLPYIGLLRIHRRSSCSCRCIKLITNLI